ncbi:MAG: class I SAM-dependent methyltransferase [Acidobacteriota bacterium]|nr:class I SAM-dependent methyltransferase [Acidobacteriota bacterium]
MLFSLILLAAAAPPRVVYLDAATARPALSAYPTQRPSDWPIWIRRHDREIRDRILRGDEDSMVNYLLFGTSFTTAPRVTERDLDTQSVGQAMTQRINDLLTGIAAPGSNERLQALHQLMAQHAQPRQYILDNLARVMREQRAFASAMQNAGFEERSRLYRERGLSLDTSFPPNYAVEETLKALHESGQLPPIRHAGVIGPGLDFTDKHEGYDFYPQQTLQPFALIDSLTRLGIARLPELSLAVFDLSPRLNAHLAAAVARARAGTGYVIQLPRDQTKPWEPGAAAWWERFGGEIGRSVPPVAVPAAIQGVETRAVEIRPAAVLALRPADLNIVCQHMAGDQFDLIVATNIFLYYDEFEQALALRNAAQMLRPGGLLISNNALPGYPESGFRVLRRVDVTYSPRKDDGDRMLVLMRQ